MSADADAIAKNFVEFSRKKLMEECWPRVCSCLDWLTEEQIWWRPNEESNSIGNLLLHLNGNLTQWVVAALRNEPDHRRRDTEFAERTSVPSSQLRERLGHTLERVEEILKSLKPEDLRKTYTIQRYENVTALDAVFHVTEHFAMHYGQILYITKMLKGADLGFYSHLSGWNQ
jgi:hypothetical protein